MKMLKLLTFVSILAMVATAEDLKTNNATAPFGAGSITNTAKAESGPVNHSIATNAPVRKIILYGYKTPGEQLSFYTDCKPVLLHTNDLWKVSFGETNALEILVRGVADESYRMGASEGARRAAIEFTMQDLGGQKAEGPTTIINRVIGQIVNERQRMWESADLNQIGNIKAK